jgi:hypothetical protein
MQYEFVAAGAIFFHKKGKMVFFAARKILTQHGKNNH